MTPSAPDTAALADLVERLRAVESSSEKSGRDVTNWYRNPDGPEAASAITDLRQALAASAAREERMRGHVETAERVLGAIPAYQNHEGCVVWSVMDDVPEDIYTARSYLQAALSQEAES